ncbi:MAG: type II secretion system GspH family protein [Bifidobacteriaceae bacterium]|jgi:type II secretory pathway pseudopilin PulG|nr:type II secretion system GspH family protein [Bifidobacteriaceae bacterium]
MTLVEVVVTILLLAILTATAGILVARTTARTVDNRARIGASALAQRELDLAATVISASADGVESLLNPQTAINPNLTDAMASGDDEYPFQLGGQKFRVERTVERRAIGSGSPCQGGTGAAQQLAALVQVRVTWAGMGPTTRPHITSALFPPHAGAAAEALGNRAVIGVKVTGVSDSASTARPGIRVRAAAPGFRQEAVTDSRGCAVFVMETPTEGFDVELTLLGQGSNTYVNLAREAEPTLTEYHVTAGSSRNPVFENYDRAASLVVKVEGTPDADEVTITPLSSAAGDEITAPIVDGIAEFDRLHPSTYGLRIGSSTPISITLTPGERLTEEVVIP